MMRYAGLIIAFAALFLSPALIRPAQAACAAPAGNAGVIFYNSTGKIFQYCNDTSWVNMGQAGTGAGGCASPTLAEGQMIYNADYRVLQGCAGATQQAFGSPGGEEKWTVLSVGFSLTCGVRTDGTLLCWGDTGQGNFGDGTGLDTSAIPVKPNNPGPWKTVSMSMEHTCAIKNDDHLYCWGRNDNGRLGVGGTAARITPTEVSGGGTWKYISAGNAHTCAIKTDDTLWCWGNNSNGQLGDNSTTQSLVPTASAAGSWKAVGAGTTHTCAIKSDDTIWCWGINNNNQLGDNTTTQSLIPVAINGGGTWKKLSVGGTHTCAIKSDDTLWCWGHGGSGKLGDGATTNNPVPTEVTGGGSWLMVHAGSISASNSCGVKTNGTLWCWGINTSGQIGDGTLTQRTVPTASIAGSDWVAAGIGLTHACGMRTNGVVQCWGNTTDGRLGDNSISQSLTPTAISDGGTWKQASAGQFHTCGIKSDDSLWCWGSNANGQLGDNSTIAHFLPAVVSGGGTWKQVSNGAEHTCGIKSDDTLWCWGRNTFGQLGDNTSGTDRSVPTAVSGGSTWKYVDSGWTDTCGIKSDDSLWCWGRNDTGQDGDNSTTQRLVPTAVSGGGTWKQVSTSRYHTCGIKTDDSMWCWGFNDTGKVGDNTTTQRLVPTAVSGGGSWLSVSAGNAHNCAVKDDATLWCWGWNNSGRLGDNTTTQRLVPTAVNGGGNWLKTAAGGGHTCSIKADNSLWCWGYNANGQLGDNSITTRLVPTAVSGGGAAWSSVVAGEDYSCAIGNNGINLYCWGLNTSGQTTATEFSAPYKLTPGSMWCNYPPAKPGGMVYNTDTDVIQYCDGAGWVSVGGTAPELVAVPDGLVGYWKFDETSGTSAADSSGNGRTGTLTNMDGNTDWVAGHLGNALDFDGTNDFVSVTSAPALDNIKPVSACAWIYRRATGVSFPIILDKSSDGMDGFNMYMDGSLISYYSNDGDYKKLGSLSTNTWYHVCYTYSGAGAGTTSADIKLYLNGVELSPGASSIVNGTPSDDSLSNMTIGSGASNTYPFNGMIDELRLYNRVLTPAEIQTLAGQ